MSRLVLGVFLVAALPLTAAAQPQELLVCGWDEVYILNVSNASAPPAKVWSWKARDRPELPAHIKTQFKTTSDCKPASNNRILIVASDDGVALVDRASGKAVFWGACVDAHSAEMLPGDRIVVACSVRNDSNRLTVFDARTPERALFTTELYSAHGAVWDEQRRVLWAVGGRALNVYSLAEWSTDKPSLKLEASYPLPAQGGHDLYEVGSPRMLGVTAVREAWYFDRDAHTFNPHPNFASAVGIKSASVHPNTKQIVFTKADAPEWWTATIRFLSPDRTVTREGERIYKVRWMR